RAPCGSPRTSGSGSAFALHPTNILYSRSVGSSAWTSVYPSWRCLMHSEIPSSNVAAEHFRIPRSDELECTPSTHAPRILLLYGSVRKRSFSRFLSEEAGRLLTAMGAEVRFFNPSGLPLPDDAPDTHPKVRE